MADEELVVPVAVEELRVGKRTVERTVRLHKRVRTESVPVEADLQTERVTVERVPVDRIVEVAPVPYRDGDAWVYPVVEEELVVVRRLRVREEVRVTHTSTVERSVTHVERRVEEIEIERGG